MTESNSRKFAAFTLPIVVFALLAGANSLLQETGNSPHYWIYPVQTIVGGIMLIWFRQEYPLQVVRHPMFVVAVALLVFVLWIAPQQFLGFPPRRDGFDPEIFSVQPFVCWIALGLRFLRLVIVVPLIEEIFFRGFLLRYFIRESFDSIPIGTFSWSSFALVTIGFGLSHSRADWPAALIAGALYNLVAYRTKSLTSCVLVHAATNLFLGLWIMQTRQWGFW